MTQSILARVQPEQVTLVIEGWNAHDLESERLFTRSLESIRRQSYPVGRCTVIIIVEAGTAPAELSRMQAILPMARFLQVPAPTYYRFKNKGLAAATGEYVVFADSDVHYAEEWLDNLLGCFSDTVDLVAGNTLYERGLFARTLSLCDWGATRLDSGPTNWFYGNNVAMRRRLYERIRFRDDLGTSGGGAVNVLREQLEALGVQPWFCAEAKGWHHLAPFFTKRMRVGGYQIAFRRRAPETAWSWLAQLPILAPFLVTAGTAIRACQRAWRLRSTLPGRGATLPFYLVAITAVKAVEWCGAALVAWMPGYVNRRFGWFEVPPESGDAPQPA